MGTRESVGLDELAGRYAAAIRKRERLEPFRRRDPELQKHLARIYAALVDAQRLQEAHAFREHGAEERLLDLARIGPETLDELDLALEVNERWDELLIDVGDAEYLIALLLSERHRTDAGTPVVTWEKLYGDLRLPAEEAYLRGDPVGEELLAPVRRRLGALARARLAHYRLFRSRQQMRSRALLGLAPVLGVLVLLLGVAIALAGDGATWEEILLAGGAGAVGATMSGAYKLRDQVEGINAVRRFHAAVWVQPLLGAAAGLFLLLVLVSGLLVVGGADLGWAKIGAVGFAAGFSEPFVLGVVGRVGSIGEQDDEDGKEG